MFCPFHEKQQKTVGLPSCVSQNTSVTIPFNFVIIIQINTPFNKTGTLGFIGDLASDCFFLSHCVKCMLDIHVIVHSLLSAGIQYDECLLFQLGGVHSQGVCRTS